MKMYGRYADARKLGIGSFGLVVLDDKQNMAVKIVRKRDQQKIELAKKQINIMKQLKNNKHVVHYEKKEEDQHNLYVFMEYCDQRDLKIMQSRQSNQCFKLEEAKSIMADVIRGISFIHHNGFIHRDIKNENIMIKEENGRNVYKIGDFGLSKKGFSSSSVLGTSPYMSPEIHKGEYYGQEVDIWALGVLFYFLLNAEHPFEVKKINLNNQRERQEHYRELIEQVEKFSYREAVAKSKKKNQQNCTKQIEEFFSRIFQINPTKRITIEGIKKTDLFREFFKEEGTEEQEYRGKKISRQQTIHSLKESVTTISTKSCSKSGINVSLSENNRNCLNLTRDNDELQQYFSEKNSKIQFLWEIYNQFRRMNCIKNIPYALKISVYYSIVKYYIVLKKNFIQEIKTGIIKGKNTQIKKQLLEKFQKSSQSYQNYSSSLELDNALHQFHTLYRQCSQNLTEIVKENQFFSSDFSKEINYEENTCFPLKFKLSYRKAFALFYSFLKKIPSHEKSRISYFYIFETLIAFQYNKIMEDHSELVKSIALSFERENLMGKNFNFMKMNEMMRGISKKETVEILNRLSLKYIQK